MNKKKLLMMVVYHKDSFIPEDEAFFPIQVNCKKAINKLKMPGDDTGENISEQNENYCELTAMYWMWKNQGYDYEYIGLNHYRRFFVLEEEKPFSIQFRRMSFNLIKNGSLFEVLFPHASFNPVMVSLNSNINDRLNNCLDNLQLEKDIIYLSEKWEYILTVEKAYQLSHRADDLAVTERVIAEKYPAFMKSYENVIKNGKQLSLFNMFIMYKEYFYNYCKWLFDILFEVEKRIKISEDPYQKRVFGYLAERLLNVYINYLVENEGVKVKYLDVVMICEKIDN